MHFFPKNGTNATILHLRPDGILHIKRYIDIEIEIFATLSNTNLCQIKGIHTFYELCSIIPDRILRTRKQSGVRRILKVCKERARVSTVKTHSQNSVK